MILRCVLLHLLLQSEAGTWVHWCWLCYPNRSKLKTIEFCDIPRRSTGWLQLRFPLASLEEFNSPLVRLHCFSHSFCIWNLNKLSARSCKKDATGPHVGDCRSKWTLFTLRLKNWHTIWCTGICKLICIHVHSHHLASFASGSRLGAHPQDELQTWLCDPALAEAKSGLGDSASQKQETIPDNARQSATCTKYIKIKIISTYTRHTSSYGPGMPRALGFWAKSAMRESCTKQTAETRVEMGLPRLKVSWNKKQEGFLQTVWNH